VIRKTAIEMLFDDGLDRAVRALQKAVGSPLPGWGARPHISLAVGVRDGIEDALAAFAGTVAPLRVHLAAVGTFSGDQGVLYLAPVLDRALLDLHAAAHDALRDHVEESEEHYRPGNWMPHCTITVGIDDAALADAVVRCRAVLPLAGTLTRLAVHEADIDPERPGWERVRAMRYRRTMALTGGF